MGLQQALNQDEADEEAAFELAFDVPQEGPTDEPAAPTEPAPVLEAPKPDEPKKEAAEPAADPFKDLPPQVRDMLAIIPRLENQVREVVGRNAALQSAVDKMKLVQPPADAAAPPSSKRFKAVDALRGQLPEIADALDEIADAIPTAPAPEAPAPVSHGTPSDNPQEQFLDKMRPGWDADMLGTDFQLWLTGQPPEFKKTVASTNDATVILKALSDHDAYRKTTPNTQPPAPAAQVQDIRSRRMAAAVQPAGDGRRHGRAATTEDEEQAAMDAAFKSA